MPDIELCACTLKFRSELSRESEASPMFFFFSTRKKRRIFIIKPRPSSSPRLAVPPSLPSLSLTRNRDFQNYEKQITGALNFSFASFHLRLIKHLLPLRRRPLGRAAGLQRRGADRRRDRGFTGLRVVAYQSVQTLPGAGERGRAVHEVGKENGRKRGFGFAREK